MNKVQIDKWFALNDRVDLLISRKKIAQADAPSLLKPVREVADLDVEKELSISERQIASVERTGVLLGSAESLASTQSQERCDAFFASRPKR